ncbi:phage tail protein [Bartonella machadoae]|uniref:phage tail protein n=1 Tax=Bartonella machadoae TaxID=2893471 RepID=UPI001F4CA827|nr:tail fiber protein [Bartonella machadoae]UNE54979.1 phage tail protein [Bartonella machadoae]UNE55369.1 phage tail protein [Bartonella machadoae]
MSTIYDWSLTASENAYSDDAINWFEGQLPSTVNNSARVMMQRVKEYLTDTCGVLESVFTNDAAQQRTAIRLESKSQLKEYNNDLVLRFKARGKNIGETTLALNGLEGQAVYKTTERGAEFLSGGEFQQGCIYSVVYNHGLWQVLNPTPIPSPVPVISPYPSGTIGAFAMQFLPSDWLLCDGKAYSRSDYSALYEAIGIRWGGWESHTKFNVPDLRGVFLRGVDDDRQIDPWRSFATLQNDSIKVHDHGGESFSILNSEGEKESWHGDITILWGYELNDQQRLKLAERLGVKVEDIRVHHKFAFPHSHLHMQDVVLERSGEHETRPKNVSVVFAIKT